MGLLYLIDKNVYQFLLASHTSVWAQPNDNGPNLRLHKCIEDSSSNMVGENSSQKKDKSYLPVLRTLPSAPINIVALLQLTPIARDGVMS